MQHVGGAARLVEARGAHMFKSEFEKALFLSHIGPTVRISRPQSLNSEI